MNNLCWLFLSTLLLASLGAEEITPPPVYSHPGVAASREGGWVGHDHLLYLPSELGISVEIIKEHEEIPVTSKEIEKKALALFQEAGLQVKILAKQTEEKKEETAPSTPLPFFHLLLLVSDIPNGYVTLIDGRLFEEVDLKRGLTLPDQIYWQAITWETQTLLTSTKKELSNTLDENLKELIQAFAARVKHFREREKKEK